MDTKKHSYEGGISLNLSELIQSYANVKRIKKGGQKIVYEAELREGGRVALKTIADVTDPRVLQEIQIVKQLALDNVPQIIESGVVYDESIDEDVLYIIEEYIDGISLRDWINSGNKFSLTTAYNAIYALLSIEIELEKNNILHRDINPNNIIMCNDENFYLIDFGLAKNLAGTSLTRTAAAHGPFTPGYAPHEQFANMKLFQDVRTDLFQIGVTVYESCNGKNPFVEPSDTVQQIMSRTMAMSPPLLSMSGDTNGLFAQFINMLMAKNQSQRPNTAADAMRYLEAIKSSLVLGV